MINDIICKQYEIRGVFMSIWKKEVAFDQTLYDNIDTFFEQLHGSKGLEYRESQHTMALDIMDAIKNKEVLLIEARSRQW